MPERPKYERLGDEEAIRLDDMRPKHAYIDGDSVLSEADAHKERDRQQSESTPIVNAAAPSPLRMPRAPTAPYPLHDDDDFHTPQPALLPGAAPVSGRASPIRRDFQPSPVRNTFSDSQYAHGRNGYFDNSYDTSYNGDGGGGGYRDDGHRNNDGYHNNYEQFYYENSGGGHGASRGGGFNV